MDKQEWIDLIDCIASDEAERLTQEDKEKALALAFIRYSTDRPRMEAADVVTENGYTVPLPDGWEQGFSRAIDVELPGSFPPVMLKNNSLQPHRIPGQDILLLVTPQKEGATLRIHFTLPHMLTETIDTVPVKDREAVVHWAAGILLDSLSSKYAGDTQSTINSDSVDHASKMPNYKSLAEAQRQAYWNHLGINPKRTVASGTVIKVGDSRLLHGAPRSRRRS